MKSLNNFCVKEITNAHFIATLYHDIMEANSNKADDGIKSETMSVDKNGPEAE